MLRHTILLTTFIFPILVLAAPALGQSNCIREKQRLDYATSALGKLEQKRSGIEKRLAAIPQAEQFTSSGLDDTEQRLKEKKGSSVLESQIAVACKPENQSLASLCDDLKERKRKERQISNNLGRSEEQIAADNAKRERIGTELEGLDAQIASAKAKLEELRAAELNCRKENDPYGVGAEDESGDEQPQKQPEQERRQEGAGWSTF